MAKQRISRKEQRRQEHQKQRRRRILLIGVPIAIVLVVLVGLSIRTFGQSVEGAVDFGSQERGHDEGVVYEEGDLPPVGGVHSPAWQSCGIYAEVVDTKNAIHAMEHGAVWISYDSELPAEDVTTLQDRIRQLSRGYLLLAPFENLKSDVVLTAWGVQLEVDGVADERIDQFIEQYQQGPQTPEPGARCDGGVGAPIG